MVKKLTPATALMLVDKIRTSWLANKWMNSRNTAADVGEFPAVLEMIGSSFIVKQPAGSSRLLVSAL